MEMLKVQAGRHGLSEGRRKAGPLVCVDEIVGRDDYLCSFASLVMAPPTF